MSAAWVSWSSVRTGDVISTVPGRCGATAFDPAEPHEWGAYGCTRDPHPDDPHHVAQGTTGTVMATWREDDPDGTFEASEESDWP